MPNILFEDHTWRRLRPLSWSTPSYELRCGLFNTRERVDLVTGAGGGQLLCRELLEPLHTAPGWRTARTLPAQRTLWLNGRLAPAADLVAELHGLRDQDWCWRDEHGLLAASLPPQKAESLLASWLTWRTESWTQTEWVLPSAVTALPSPTLADRNGPSELGWIWDLVPATSAAINADLNLVRQGEIHERHPFGLFPDDGAAWQRPGSLRELAAGMAPDQVHVSGSGGFFVGSGGVELAPGTHIDTQSGPVVLDSGVRIMAHAYLAGPLYVGRESLVKPGARIFGESSFGVGNRLAGEIGESTFGDFANKQHDGFMGHAVLGSWINLGALTTCSDLKNNYGPVRVDLGDGEHDTGHRFVGLMMGDHAKTAIGSLLNTGTSVGFASNIFGTGMPPKHVPNFSWGGQAGAPDYAPERARQTAAVVLARRGCRWTDDHSGLFNYLYDLSQG